MQFSLSHAKRPARGDAVSIGAAKARENFRKFLLSCGLLSSLLYLVMNIFIPGLFPGYKVLSQTISELSAIGAPSRPTWLLWGYLYTFLVVAFAWGVWQSADQARPMRVLRVLLIIYAISGLLWPFTPMHLRETLAAEGGTLTDKLHIAFGILTVLLMILMMAFGAYSLGKGFRWYSLVSLGVLVISGFLTGMEAPNIAKNLSTPLIGLWERINIGIFMTWLILLSVMLLLKKESSAATPREN
ncbi:MAG: DUF998 domain-containing protein [Flavisolibacter sp.]